MTAQEVRGMRWGQRWQVIQAALAGQWTNAQAAAALHVSVRQVQRLKCKVRTQGKEALRHGNCGRAPANKTPVRQQQRALELVKTTYANYNFAHLADTFADQHQLTRSPETWRRWLRAAAQGPPPRRLRGHRRRRPRKQQFGELLFLDGSPHHWFGPDHPPVCLLLCSDDATGQPLFGKFQPTEDRNGCFEVCHHVFTRFGLPKAFYLDRASQFKTTRVRGLEVVQSDHQPTHFQRAMSALGVGLHFAHSPQARGRAERLNGSFQGRLVNELLHHRISDCQRATRFLNQSFIPRYVKLFARPPQNPLPAWRPAPSADQLLRILCAQLPRNIANDNTVQLNGLRYQLFPPRRLFRVSA